MLRLRLAAPATLLALLALVQLVVPVPIFAQVISAPPPPAHTQSPGALDLSSTAANVHASSVQNFQPTNILVNGHHELVTSSSLLTPAEMLAVQQVLHTGTQSLILGTAGNAVGGSLSIPGGASSQMASLLVPHGVTVVDLASVLNVSGNLTNAGNFYAVSTNPAVTSATVNAVNITNTHGGLISTVLPAGGLPGVTNAARQLDLSLHAINNIVNAGTISSSGSLSLAAGGSIVNTKLDGLLSSPLLQASRDINLTSLSGSFANSGVISSQAGNVNLSTGEMVANLVLDNAAGTIQAPMGAVNFRTTGNADVDLTGGDLLSQQVNFNAGNGAVNASVNNITGVVNTSAGAAHILSNTPNLQLGTTCLSGDPTYYNSGGSVTFPGTTTVTGDLAIVASQNIVVGNLVSSPGVGQNGDMTLVAGAHFNPIPTPVSASSDVTTTITIDGGSSTGGSVSVGAINTNGGNLVVAAYHGTTSGSGAIKIGGAVNTGAGNVTMIAGATSGRGVSTGNITSTGAITLLTATPQFGGGASTLSIKNGTANPSPPFATTGLTQVNSSVACTGTLSAPTVTLGAGTGGLGTLTTNASNLSVGTTGSANIVDKETSAPLSANGSASSFALTANMDMSGSINGKSVKITDAGHAVSLTTNAPTVTVNSAGVGVGAAGGTITVSESGSALAATLNAGGAPSNVKATAGGNAGGVTITTDGTVSGTITATGGANTASGGTGGTGGAVNLIAASSGLGVGTLTISNAGGTGSTSGSNGTASLTGNTISLDTGAQLSVSNNSLSINASELSNNGTIAVSGASHTVTVTNALAGQPLVLTSTSGTQTISAPGGVSFLNQGAILIDGTPTFLAPGLPSSSAVLTINSGTPAANGGAVATSSGAVVHALSVNIVTNDFNGSAAGDVGSAGTPFATSASNLQINTNGGALNNAGNVFIKDTNTGTTSINVAAEGGNSFPANPGGSGGAVLMVVTGPVAGSINTNGGAGTAGGSAGVINIQGAASLTVGSAGLSLSALGGAGMGPMGASADAFLHAPGAVSLLGTVNYLQNGPSNLTIQSAGGGSITEAAGKSIVTNSGYLILAASSGSIGVPFGPVVTDAAILTANTTNSVNLLNIGSGPITLGPSSGSSFMLVASQPISMPSGSITAHSLTITDPAHNVQVNTNASALSVNAAGKTAGAGGATVILADSATGAISVALNASGAASAVAGTPGGAAGILSLATDATVGGTITAVGGANTAPGGTGGAGGTVVLTAATTGFGVGVLNISNTGGKGTTNGSNGAASLDAGTLTLGSAASLSVSNNSLTLNVGTLSNSGTIAVTGTGKTISVVSAGQLNLNSNGGAQTMSAPGGIALLAGQDVDINGSQTFLAPGLAASLYVVSIKSGGNGGNIVANPLSVLYASSVNVSTQANAGFSAGNVGAAGSPLTTNAAKLEVNTIGGEYGNAGSVYVKDIYAGTVSANVGAQGGAGLTTNPGGNGGAVSIIVNGSLSGSINTDGGLGNSGGNAGLITVQGVGTLTVAAAGLSLDAQGGLGSGGATGASGNAVVQAAGSVAMLGTLRYLQNGNSSLTIQAGGAGSITEAAGKSIVTNGGTLVLVSTSGNIGLPFAPVVSDAGILSANTAGSVNLLNIGGVPITLGSSSGGSFMLVASQPISMPAGSVTTRSLTIKDPGLNVQVSTSATSVSINTAGNAAGIGGGGITIGDSATGNISLALNANGAASSAAGVTAASAGSVMVTSSGTLQGTVSGVGGANTASGGTGGSGGQVVLYSPTTIGVGTLTIFNTGGKATTGGANGTAQLSAGMVVLQPGALLSVPNNGLQITTGDLSNSGTIAVTGAGNQINVSDGGGITVESHGGLQTMTAPGGTILNSGGGISFIGSQTFLAPGLSASSYVLTLEATGGDVTPSSGTVIHVSSISASTFGGSFGTQAVPFSTSAAILNLNTGNGASNGGGVFVTDTNTGTTTLNISAQGSSYGGLSLTPNGGSVVITTAGAVSGSINTSGGSNPGTLPPPPGGSAGAIAISSKTTLSIASGGLVLVARPGPGTFGLPGVATLSAVSGINLNGSVNASNTFGLTIQSTGVGSITQSSFVVTTAAPNLTLSVTDGNLGASTQALVTQTGALNESVSAGHFAFVQNSGGPLSLTVPASTTAFSLSNSDSITLNGNFTTGTLSLATTGNNGSITLSGNATAQTAIFSAAGSGTIVATAGMLTATNAAFISSSGAISVNGKLGTVVSNTGGNVTINSSQNTVFKSLFNISNTVGGSLSAAVAGSLTISSLIQASTFTLSATNNLLTTPGGSIVAGSSLTVSSNIGNIGSSAVPLLVQTPSLSANTAGSGSVWVVNGSAQPLTLDSGSGHSFSVSTTGPLTVASSISTTAPSNTSTGNLSLVSGSTLTVNADLLTSGGSVTLRNQNPFGSIAINGATISTNVTTATKGTNGVVRIYLGSATYAVNPTLGWSGVSVNRSGSGQVFLGQNPNQVIVAGGGITLNATNQSIFFNVPSSSVPFGPVGSITLGGSTTITADPPAPSAGLPLPPIQLTHAPNVQPAAVYNYAAPVAPTPSPAPVPALVAGAGVAGISSAMTAALASQTTYANSDVWRARGTLPNVGKVLEGGIEHGASGNKFSLGRGKLLAAPAQDVTIATPMGNITVKAGAVVLIVSNSSRLSVYNLHDTKIGAVTVLTGERSYELKFGQHLSLTRGGLEFADVNPLPLIGHRNLRSSATRRTTVYLSDFSIVSAMKNLDVLSGMAHSAERAERKMFNRIMKDAAITVQMGTGKGAAAYRQYRKPPGLLAAQAL